MNSRATYFTYIIFTVFLLSLVIGCQFIDDQKSPPGYQLNRPAKEILKKKLAEISGIFYIPQEKTILAIADDQGMVFAMDSLGKNIFDYLPKAFAETQDYEDIIKVDSIIYVLISDGTILQINKNADVISRVNLGLSGKNDFETMYYEPSSNGVVILCKKCALEKNKKIRTAFRFDIKTNKFDTGSYYTISTQAVNDILKDGEAEFSPSAAAIHPFQKKLYILSSAGNLLVITDLKGRVERAFRINPDLFPQAEGITFNARGQMYISNEAKLGKPSLLTFRYRNN
jgi:uncharacterized protein YjiK